MVKLNLPGRELIVSHTPSIRDTLVGEGMIRLVKSTSIDGEHKDVELAVRDAFRIAQRRLREHARRRSALTAVADYDDPLTA